MQWLCCKYESINVTTFTFHSYEINTSNYYDTQQYFRISNFQCIQSTQS
jgi:hypothetical protein